MAELLIILHSCRAGYTHYTVAEDRTHLGMSVLKYPPILKLIPQLAASDGWEKEGNLNG